uniref:Partial AB-hydrolase lipase domain-containing protein n=1 Tax=Strigamia maritima TaxID=126957 RepID=T1JB84_STRMM
MLFLRSAIVTLTVALVLVNARVEYSKSNQFQVQAQEELFHLRDGRAIPIDPEAYMTIEEIIKYHGYPLQVYDVITNDGYILTVHRIPYGKAGPGTKPRKPVMVQHGLLCSATSWILDVPNKNLPYLLADAGYDVWLGNVRGTVFDEMAKYDVPAVIDFIVTKSEYKQIYYIGHSMGTSMMFALLSTQPKYNEIVKTFFALAPVARLKNVKTPLRFLAPFSRSLDWILNTITTGEFLTSSPLMKFFTSTICASRLSFLCEHILFSICGFNAPELNSTRVPVYLHHTPAGTSVQTLVHYAQLVSNGNRFQKFDYGSRLNRQKYGQSTVPEYNLKNITTQVALFYSSNDYLATIKDVDWLTSRLNKLVLKYHVSLIKFSHLDFLWAIDLHSMIVSYEHMAPASTFLLVRQQINNYFNCPIKHNAQQMQLSHADKTACDSYYANSNHKMRFRIILGICLFFQAETVQAGRTKTCDYLSPVRKLLSQLLPTLLGDDEPDLGYNRQIREKAFTNCILMLFKGDPKNCDVSQFYSAEYDNCNSAIRKESLKKVIDKNFNGWWESYFSVAELVAAGLLQTATKMPDQALKEFCTKFPDYLLHRFEAFGGCKMIEKVVESKKFWDVSLDLTDVMSLSNIETALRHSAVNWYKDVDDELEASELGFCFLELADAIDFIKLNNFSHEEHTVSTQDGYFIKIQRLIKKDNPKTPNYPVLLMHGLNCYSVIWVDNCNASLAFILANQGYDVWLGNIRGNPYGREHLNRKLHSKQFWNFSFHENGVQDLPSIIDFILKKTGFHQIHYIGHSMGTTMMFVLLSSKPEYNTKLKSFMALAPVAYISHVLPKFQTVMDNFNFIKGILTFFNQYALIPNPTVNSYFLSMFCPNGENKCDNLISMVAGNHTSLLNKIRKSHNFSQYDYESSKLNIQHYDSAIPPKYNLTKVTAPVALFWSEGDFLSDTRDVKRLRSQLPNVILDYKIPFKNFTHADFIWAINASQF